MTLQFNSILACGIVVTASVLMTACSPDDGEASSTHGIPGMLPTADELAALYNTALDYGVPLSDRVNLIQGVDEADPRLAQKFVQEGMTVEFHAVLDPGDGSLLAFGNPVINGQPQPEGSPIPFVDEDRAWKIARSWACSQAGC